MKKILLVMSVAIFIALCSAPSFVKASVTDGYYIVGSCITNYASSSLYEADVYSYQMEAPLYIRLDYSGWYEVYMHPNPAYASYLYILHDGSMVRISPYQVSYMFIPSLTANTTLANVTVYNNVDDYYDNIPPEFVPVEPSLAQQRWDEFYEWYKLIFGYYPVEGSLIDLLRKLALGDETADTEIVFPTLIPTPSPTPTPTPIPVQTMFVPDGNGGTTVIYQYTDPTTGVITQSPYNPNIENNITVDCDCDSDGNGTNFFGNDPTDPYTLTSSMLWQDGFGVQITDNPLSAANDSQKSLAEAAAEYSDSVNVVSNAFNVLPFKWLALVGLLGGILIIAGLMRTFLGG